MLRRKFRMTRSADFRGIVIAWVALLTCMAALTYANQNMPIRSLAGQSCWVLSSEDVELAVTRQGGHMAPVTFCRKDRQPVQPYYISPWQQEKVAIDEPVMRPLRGNFFCLPFGANQESVEGVKFPAHGETAGQPWTLVNAGRSGATTTLTLALKTKVRPGKVTKTITLVDGQNAVYTRHVIEGFSGKAPLGHHATLAVPEKEGVLRVATSLFAFGMTAPVLFSDPAQGEYQSFAIHARFQRFAPRAALVERPLRGRLHAVSGQNRVRRSAGDLREAVAGRPAGLDGRRQPRGRVPLVLAQGSGGPTFDRLLD